MLLTLFTGCGGPRPGEGISPSSGASPAAGVRPGTLELRRWRGPAERVVIEPGGVALGPEGEPLAHYLFVSRDRLQDLGLFVRTYAPFRVTTPRGELAFGGRGTATAGPTERRMILEWARLAAVEVSAGRNASSYGLVFAWHRGGAVGSCDDLSVFLTGEVRASSCSWAGEGGGGGTAEGRLEVRGRLAPEELARIYAWFDGLGPFQESSEEGTGQIREPSRLIFAGQGRREAKRDAIAEIRALAPALHRELAARRPGAVAQEEAEEKGTKTTEPLAGRLLLPPDTAVAGVPAAAIPAGLQPPEGPHPLTPSPVRAPTPPPRAGEGEENNPPPNTQGVALG